MKTLEDMQEQVRILEDMSLDDFCLTLEIASRHTDMLDAEGLAAFLVHAAARLRKYEFMNEAMEVETNGNQGT